MYSTRNLQYEVQLSQSQKMSSPATITELYRHRSMLMRALCPLSITLKLSIFQICKLTCLPLEHLTRSDASLSPKCCVRAPSCDTYFVTFAQKLWLFLPGTIYVCLPLIQICPLAVTVARQLLPYFGVLLWQELRNGS